MRVARVSETVRDHQLPGVVEQGGRSIEPPSPQLDQPQAVVSIDLKRGDPVSTTGFQTARRPVRRYICTNHRSRQCTGTQQAAIARDTLESCERETKGSETVTEKCAADDEASRCRADVRFVRHRPRVIQLALRPRVGLRPATLDQQQFTVNVCQRVYEAGGENDHRLGTLLEMRTGFNGSRIGGVAPRRQLIALHVQPGRHLGDGGERGVIVTAHVHRNERPPRF